MESFVSQKTVAGIIKSGGKARALRVFQKMLGELYKAILFPNPTSKTRAGVFLDSNPENFSISSKGKVVYVDFYPPKLFDSNGYLKPFISRLHSRNKAYLSRRYGDKRAILFFAFRKASRLRPELRKDFLLALITFLKVQKNEDLANYFERMSKKIKY
ncbi:MAG: hypothetical protein WCW13_06600 [archaeon]